MSRLCRDKAPDVSRRDLGLNDEIHPCLNREVPGTFSGGLADAAVATSLHDAPMKDISLSGVACAEGVPPSSGTTPPIVKVPPPVQWSSAPVTHDRLLANCMEKIYSGVTRGGCYDQACAEIAGLFGASQVRLRCGLPGSSGFVSAASPLLVFDRTTSIDLLARALSETGADHGMCAFIRDANPGVDVLIVLRRSIRFGWIEREWMELLARHLGTAFDLGQRFDAAAPTFASAVRFAQLLPHPCVLAEATGLCVAQNEGFAGILHRIGGAVRGGRLVFDDSRLQDSWRRALQDAQASDAPRSFVAGSPARGRWKVHVVPLPSTASHRDPVRRRVMLVTFESTGVEDQRAEVRYATPLTKAEQEVLSMLLRGLSAKAIARARNASVNTVRTQITSILGKTGHHTQKQLIASSSSMASPPSHGTPR